MRLSLGEGVVAVGIARHALAAEASGTVSELPSDLPGPLSEPAGSFVTVSESPSGMLRACIGYPDPIMPLGESVVRSARGAVHDPRFPVLTPGEVAACTVEVTVLTPPEDLVYAGVPELLESIEIGRDGLILEHRGRRASLFLPQVPVEQGWDKEEYLTHLCLKAGLPGDIWRTGRARFKTFRGQIFKEDEPSGNVSEVSLRCRKW